MKLIVTMCHCIFVDGQTQKTENFVAITMKDE